MKDFSKNSLLQDLKRALPATLRDSPMVERSFLLAFGAHSGQVREAREATSSPLPYIVHPVGVAKFVAAYWVDGELPDSLETLVCVALMHDVLEDTQSSYDNIRSATSQRCADLVFSLTKPEVGKTGGRSLRNQLFLEQIRRAGNSAIFTKICDSLHNLSRPGSMSTSLLKKTIEKAKGPYASLLPGTPFEERMGAALQSNISTALEVYGAHQDDDDHLQADQLHLYLEMLTRKTKGKELESHDVIEILSQLNGVMKCAIGDLQECVSACLSLYPGLFSPNEQERILTDLKASCLGHFELPRSDAAESSGAALQLFVCRVSDSKIWIGMVADSRRTPHWLCLSAFYAIVGLLSDRLARRHAGEVFGLAERVWEELALDPHTFLEEDLGRHDLARLKSSLEFAELMFLILRPTLEAFCKGSDVARQIDRVEGRTKKPGSILRKLRDRGVQLQDIDDFIGFRIIFVSSQARDSFSEKLRNAFHTNEKTVFYFLPIVADSICLDEVSSNSGYTAKHLRLAFSTPVEFTSSVGCEIQLRTLQEDAWARVSESLVYKERLVSKKKAQHLLDHLSRLRDEADRQINEARQAP